MDLVVLAGAAFVVWLLLSGKDQTSDAAQPDAQAPQPGTLDTKSPMDALQRTFEGFRRLAYQDGAGQSIGYGHQLQPGESYPDGVTQAQAEALLAQDRQKASDAIVDQVKVPLNTNQFEALLDWVFNLGAGNLQKSTLLAKLNAGDYGAVGQEMARWDYANGAPSTALDTRRAAEASLWES